MKANSEEGVLTLDLTMPNGTLAQLPIFLAVAELQSFTAASRALGISPSAASQAVARLERGLGA